MIFFKKIEKLCRNCYTGNGKLEHKKTGNFSRTENWANQWIEWFSTMPVPQCKLGKKDFKYRLPLDC